VSKEAASATAREIRLGDKWHRGEFIFSDNVDKRQHSTDPEMLHAREQLEKLKWHNERSDVYIIFETDEFFIVFVTERKYRVNSVTLSQDSFTYFLPKKEVLMHRRSLGTMKFE
jgi:hypothetical protein